MGSCTHMALTHKKIVSPLVSSRIVDSNHQQLDTISPLFPTIAWSGYMCFLDQS